MCNFLQEKEEENRLAKIDLGTRTEPIDDGLAMFPLVWSDSMFFLYFSVSLPSFHPFLRFVLNFPSGTWAQNGKKNVKRTRSKKSGNVCWFGVVWSD